MPFRSKFERGEMVEKGWIGRRTCNTVGEVILVGWCHSHGGRKEDMALFTWHSNMPLTCRLHHVAAS
ncbi:hypothetical protein VNO77_09569 [Canavalia gladiata]|uniref:Uncharacterized protein n=1 Tax=Canavalia gladiata TaxID=3824 RepID=A0AAN9QXF0_CANGL